MLCKYRDARPSTLRVLLCMYIRGSHLSLSLAAFFFPLATDIGDVVRHRRRWSLIRWSCKGVSSSPSRPGPFSCCSLGLWLLGAVEA